MSVSAKRVVEEGGRAAGRPVKLLADVTDADLPHVGSKTVNVARLKSFGFNVPDGFVLMQEVYMRFTSLGGAASFLDEVRALGADIGRIHVAATSVAEPIKGFLNELAADLRQGARSISPVAGAFATRSSACDEDLDERSFAGIYVTTLGVRRRELVASVLRSWASYQSERARAYRRTRLACGIAVLVQEMIPAAKAGVAFSANPLSGSSDEVFIEAAWGLGKLVVGSRTGRDVYRVLKTTLSPIDVRVGRKETRLVLHGGRPVERTVPETMREQRVLSDRELRELSAVANSVEQLLGRPQDLEWCYYDAKLCLVQARPITCLPPTGRDIEWSRQPYLELFPEIPRPMTASYIERYWSDWQEQEYRARGFVDDGFGPGSKVVYGRPVLNLTLLKRAVTAVGIPSPIVLRSMGQTELLAGHVEHRLSVPEMLRRMPRIVRVLLRVMRTAAVARAAMGCAVRFCQDVGRSNVSSLCEEELLRTIEKSRAVDKQLIKAGNLVMAAIPVKLVQAEYLLDGYVESVEAFVNATTAVGPREPAAQAGLDLLRLAGRARSDPRVLRCFMDREVGAGYRAHLAGSTFLQEFDAFIERYGHHAVFELDPSFARYAEEPAYILSAVANYVRADEVTAPESLTNHQETLAEIHWDKLVRQLPWLERRVPVRLWIIRRTVCALQELFLLRGQIRDKESALVAAVRRYQLALAKRFGAEALLDQSDDYFWLRIDEPQRAARSAEFRGRLRDIVQKRKQEYDAYRRISVPDVFRESEIPLIALAKAEAEVPKDSGYLHGTPIGPGSGEGEIAVLDDPTELGRLRKGVILFTREIDPSWVPAFGLIEGIVAESGGILSHGAIAVREYGLPAVANVRDARRRAARWKTARVDGSTGTVELER